NDVQAWAHHFLERLETSQTPDSADAPLVRLTGDRPSDPREVETALDAFTSVPRLLIASDFDRVLAPIVADADAVQPAKEALGGSSPTCRAWPSRWSRAAPSRISTPTPGCRARWCWWARTAPRWGPCRRGCRPRCSTSRR